MMRFRALDGWRGLAAFFVVMYHFAWFFGIFLGRFFWDSYLFVDFFFVLSGFVIAHTYLDRLKEPGEPIAFVIRRFGRLWPLQIVTMLMVIAALWYVRKTPELTLWTGQGINPIITNMLMVHSFGFHKTLTLNVPSWSISVEFFAYLVFLVLAVLSPRKAMPWIAALIIAASMAIVTAYSRRYMDVHNDFGFFRCLAGFFSGFLMLMLYRRLDERGPGGTVLEIMAMAGVFWFVTVAKNGSSPVSLLAPFVFAPVVLIFAAEKGWISAILKTRPFQHIGTISYSVYMVHFAIVVLFPPMMGQVSRWTGINLRLNSFALPSPGSAWRLSLVIAIYLALVLGLANVTYYLVEQPGRRFFNRMSRRMSERRMALAIPATGREGI